VSRSATPVVRGGYVGTVDSADYYSFNLDRDSAITLSLPSVVGSAGASSSLAVKLFMQAAIVNESTPIVSWVGSPTLMGTRAVSMPRGSYVVSVAQLGGWQEPLANNNLYTLAVQSVPYDGTQLAMDPGSNKDTAHPLGALSEGVVGGGGYVGALDDKDYYAFSLTAPGKASVNLTKVVGSVRWKLYADAPIIDETKPLATGAATTGTDAVTATPELPAGRYLIVAAMDGGYQDSFNNHNHYSLVPRHRGCDRFTRFSPVVALSPCLRP
jgi:hypothetical protein